MDHCFFHLPDNNDFHALYFLSNRMKINGIGWRADLPPRRCAYFGLPRLSKLSESRRCPAGSLPNRSQEHLNPAMRPEYSLSGWRR